MIKEAYFCSSYRHIIISAIRAFKNKSICDLYLLDLIDYPKKFIDKLNNSKLFNKVIFIEGRHWYKKTNKINDMLFGAKKAKNYLDSVLNLDFSEYDDIYLFHDFTWLSFYLKYSKIPYNIIEDGTDYFKRVQSTAFSNTVKPLTLKEKFRNFLFPNALTSVSFYDNWKYIKSIEVNDKKDICLKKTDKIREYKTENYYKCLENRIFFKKILKIFGLNQSMFLKQNTIMIFTYCFETDRFLNLGEEIELYKKILEKFKNYNIILKPHPRDNVDFSSISDKCTILSKYFPGELIRYIPNNIKYYVSIYSSSVFTFPKNKIIYYDKVIDFYNDKKKY